MTDAFTPLPDGKFSESVVYPEHGVQLGLMHMDGAGLRVCTFDGQYIRHMSPAGARRLANDLEGSGFVGALEPVIAALRDLCGKVDELEAMMAANRAQPLADMSVEGHA
jgi:hypothetical protein